MIAYFISDPDSAYYKSAAFSNILASLQQEPRHYRMKEGNKKLTLTLDNIHTVVQAKERLLALKN